MAIIHQTTAHAKINLALNIIGRYDNGYHQLDMINISIKLGDIITLLDDNTRPIYQCVGEFAPQNIVNTDNIVIKTIKLCENWANKVFPYKIHVEKMVPVGAGLGGATAQACAVLRFLANLWAIPAEVCYDIAGQIGADGPFCYNQQPAQCLGVGEIIKPIMLPQKYNHILLAYPHSPLITADVFRHFAQHYTINTHFTRPPNPSEWTNDLTAPAVALNPTIGELLQQLQQTGPLMYNMSGSGSACFAIYPNQTACDTAFHALNGKYRCFITGQVYTQNTKYI